MTVTQALPYRQSCPHATSLPENPIPARNKLYNYFSADS